jgi:hypothetical protein
MPPRWPDPAAQSEIAARAGSRGAADAQPRMTGASPSGGSSVRTTVLVYAGNDIDVIPSAHDIEAFEPQLPIGRAFSGLEIVFMAVPRADELNLRGGEFLSLPVAVGGTTSLCMIMPSQAGPP